MALDLFSLALVFLAMSEETQALALRSVALLELTVTSVQRLGLLAASSPTCTESFLLTARPNWKLLFLAAPTLDSQASSRVVLLVTFLAASRES